MNKQKFLWNRLLPANQVIVKFRHKLVAEAVFYLFPNEREARRCIEKMRMDPDIDQTSIISREVKDLFQVS